MHAENILELAAMGKEIGAEGIFILRGVGEVYLAYNVQGQEAFLDLADAPIFVVMRFPTGDGEAEGVESL